MITKTKARTPAVCNFEATRKALLRAMRNAKEREHYDTVRSLACRCLEYCETGVRTGAKDIRERAVTGISEIAGESETMKLISKETRAAMIRTYSELLGDTSESVRVSAIKGLAQPELMLDCSGIILSRVTSNALRSREDFALATVIRAHSDGLRKVSEAGRRVNSTFEEKMERLAYLLHKKLDPGQTEERKMLVASMKRLGGNILPRIIEEFITSLVSTLREEAEKIKEGFLDLQLNEKFHDVLDIIAERKIFATLDSLQELLRMAGDPHEPVILSERITAGIIQTFSRLGVPSELYIKNGYDGKLVFLGPKERLSVSEDELH